MTRVFAAIAAVAVVLFAWTWFLGISLRSGNLRDPQDERTQKLATVHRLSGMATGISMLLVDSIVATWFIGTTRWCREVAERFLLDPATVAAGNAIKRSIFPVSLLHMLGMVGLAALGATTDPAARIQVAAPFGWDWRSIHFAASLLMAAFTAFTFYVQFSKIGEQHEIVQKILHGAIDKRRAAGLEG